MAAYYNEHDPFAAAWLRELVRAGAIAPGDVDERSIVDVRPDELRGYTQCHFFAGVGVWSYALRVAEWPDDRPVWTGSCPCQPFSAVGKGAGVEDERHLWPDLFRLIRECRPVVVFGEQVASQLGLAWLDVVHADLEAEDYAVGAVDLCAAGVGAPHIRQRLYWLADSQRCERGRDAGDVDGPPRQRSKDAGDAVAGCSSPSVLVDTEGRGWRERRYAALARCSGHADGAVVSGDVGDAKRPGLERHPGDGTDGGEPRRLRTFEGGSTAAAGVLGGFWADAEWIECRDGKARPVEPGSFPLAHGAPARVGRLRGYGNAINAEQAIAFIEAYLDVRETA